MANFGRFVWEELMTTDVAGAAAFYGKIAGLKTKAAPFDASYTMFQGKGGNMGGVMRLPDEATQGGTPPCWLSYVSTQDADDTARRVAALGGKVHKAPWNIAEGGRIAIVADPQGAVFAIYANPTMTGVPPAPQLGHASWHELATTDHVAAFSFYQNLFGWHIVNDMDMGPELGVYRLFAPEGMTEAFGGMYTKPPQQPGPPAWLPYIKVANVASATEAAKKLGAFVMHGPADVPGGKITMATDPQGAMFAIHQVIPPAAAKPKTKAAAKKTKPAPKRAVKARAKARKPAAAKRRTRSRKPAAPKRGATRRAKAGSKK